MKCLEIILEAKTFERIARDPRLLKMLALTFKVDHTVPQDIRIKLGPRPSEADIAKEFGKNLDEKLAATEWGDLSRDGKYDDWLIRQYISGGVEFEDIGGQAADALGQFRALSIRGLLDPVHQDINKIPNLAFLQKLLTSNKYKTELERLKNAAKIAELKKTRQQIVLMDNDRFYVTIPMNYGACYVFNREMGIQANFCTGSSTGAQWVKDYAGQSPIISILDKQNMNEKNGKWQIHSGSSQIKNATQDGESRDDVFAELFPGLLTKIAEELLDKQNEIEKVSAEVLGKPYDIPAEISRLQAKFPESFSSKAENDQQPVQESSKPRSDVDDDYRKELRLLLNRLSNQ